MNFAAFPERKGGAKELYILFADNTQRYFRKKKIVLNSTYCKNGNRINTTKSTADNLYGYRLSAVVFILSFGRVNSPNYYHSRMRLVSGDSPLFKKGIKALFHRNRFCEIAGLIDVAVASLCDIIAEQLHRNNFERRGQQLEC